MHHQLIMESSDREIIKQMRSNPTANCMPALSLYPGLAVTTCLIFLTVHSSNIQITPRKISSEQIQLEENQRIGE